MTGTSIDLNKGSHNHVYTYATYLYLQHFYKHRYLSTKLIKCKPTKILTSFTTQNVDSNDP